MRQKLQRKTSNAFVSSARSMAKNCGRHFDLSQVALRVADERYRAAANPAFLAKIDDLRDHQNHGSLSGAVLLIGLDERGPFTILDGNHRMVAAMLTSSPDLSMFRFFCGLSPNMAQCCWYRTNVATLTRYGRHRVWHYTHDAEKDSIASCSTREPMRRRCNSTSFRLGQGAPVRVLRDPAFGREQCSEKQFGQIRRQH